MFDEKERENMNNVGMNTESISSQIINEEAEKLAKEVSNTQNTGNISIGPNGLYNMNHVDNGTEVNNSRVDNTSEVNNSGVNNTTINGEYNGTVNTEASNTIYTNSIQKDNSVNSEYTNNQYADYIKRAQATPNENMGGFNGGFNNSYGNSFDNNAYQMNNMNGNNKKATKKMPIFKKFVLTAAAIALIGVTCLGGYVGYNKYKELNRKVNSLTKNNETESQIKLTTSKSKDKGVVKDGAIMMTDVSDVVSDVMPSIVAITSKTMVENYNDFNWWFGGGNEQYEQEGAGSGIIVGKTDSELLIVTNNHVVAGADSLSVKFIDEKSVEAKIKGTDPDKDLAIVAIPLDTMDSDTLSNIKIATLGDSDSLSVGDGVIAIGNALGYGQSVTTGVISALNREVNIEDKTLNLIQTDAAINGGNSGGALINSNGEVIGINSAKYSSDGYSGTASIEGMGFAIPISSALDRINELMNKETRDKVDKEKRGYLGIQGKTVTEEDERDYGIPIGAYVVKVNKGSAAEEAGIEAKDIIVAVDGDSVKNMEDLQEILEYYSVNDKIEVTIKYLDGREYKEKKVDVVLKDANTLPKDEMSDGKSDK